MSETCQLETKNVRGEIERCEGIRIRGCELGISNRTEARGSIVHGPCFGSLRWATDGSMGQDFFPGLDRTPCRIIIFHLLT